MTKTTTNQSKGKSTTTRTTRRNLYKEANGKLNRAVDVGLDKMENILRLMKEYKKNKQLINNPPTRTTKVYEENARVIRSVSLLSNELTKSVLEIKQCLRILYIILGDKGLNKRTLLLDIPKKYFKPISWHHTGAMYNETTYYDLSDVVDYFSGFVGENSQETKKVRDILKEMY